MRPVLVYGSSSSDSRRCSLYRVSYQQGSQQHEEEWVHEDRIVGAAVEESTDIANNDEDGDGVDDDALEEASYIDAERRAQQRMREQEKEAHRQYMKWWGGGINESRKKRKRGKHDDDQNGGEEERPQLPQLMTDSGPWTRLLLKDYHRMANSADNRAREHPWAVKEETVEDRSNDNSRRSVDEMLSRFVQYQQQQQKKNEDKDPISTYVRCEAVMDGLRTCYETIFPMVLLYEGERDTWLAAQRVSRSKKRTKRLSHQSGTEKRDVASITAVHHFARFLSLLPEVVHSIGRQWEPETVACVEYWVGQLMQWADKEGWICSRATEGGEEI